MQNFRIIYLILISLALSSCSIFRIDNNISQDDFAKELILWQNFRLDGIVKITDQNFNLIKNITITRDSLQLKVILYDTGIFGISPSPFARIIITDSIFIKIPSLDDPQFYDQLEELITGLEIMKSGFFDQQELLNNYSRIKRDLYYENQNRQLKFNKNLQLVSLTLKKKPLELKIKRGYSVLPEEITIYFQKKLAITIEIDKFFNIDT